MTQPCRKRRHQLEVNGSGSETDEKRNVGLVDLFRLL